MFRRTVDRKVVDGRDVPISGPNQQRPSGSREWFRVVVIFALNLILLGPYHTHASHIGIVTTKPKSACIEAGIGKG